MPDRVFKHPRLSRQKKIRFSQSPPEAPRGVFTAPDGFARGLTPETTILCTPPAAWSSAMATPKRRSFVV